MRKFFYGVLVGALIVGLLHGALNLYENHERRLGAIEGYLRQLDSMIRQSSAPADVPGRAAA
jgi:hypothetical protein